jgi:hypothetical protein
MRMSAQGPGIEKVQLIDATGAPLGVTGNPLVSSGGGGGGTVTQGPAGSALQSWYMRDGSGLLATAALQTSGNASLTTIATNGATSAKQDTGNASLSSIDGKLTDGSQLTKIYGESGVAANTLPANSYVTTDYSSVVATLSHGNAATRVRVLPYNCASAELIFPDDPSYKFRKIYNPSLNGLLCVRYGDNAISSELEATLVILPGDSWTMPTIGGAPEFSGEVYAINLDPVKPIITTYGYN